MVEGDFDIEFFVVCHHVFTEFLGVLSAFAAEDAQHGALGHPEWEDCRVLNKSQSILSHCGVFALV